MPNPILHNVALAGSIGASSLTAWRGAMLVEAVAQPAKLLRLYDYEACPYCRRVREALTALALPYLGLPCPRGGERYRPEAIALGGKRQFPLLADDNTGAVLYESADIVAYLFETYAKRPVPKQYVTPLAPLLGGLASGLRGGRGTFARASRQPEQPLRLWSFEASPYSRLVRERLCELELAHVVHQLPKEHWREVGPAARRIQHPYTPRPGGPREVFWKRHGRVQVPYLEDPNTETELFESAAIIDYLEHTYARD